MRKKILRLATVLIVIGLIVYYITNVYALIAKTYYVNEADLHRIDTFHLFGRAHEETKHVGKYSSKSYLAFESTNGYSFSIADNAFLAIKDKQKLEDTLMYHNIKFTVFSNRENYNNYRNNKKPMLLEVYQMQIGDTKYIDNSFLNKLLKGDKLLVVLCTPLAVIFLGVLSHKSGGDNPWTLRKINLFAVGSFLVFLLILVGIILFS
jgi:hypothetical protein